MKNKGTLSGLFGTSDSWDNFISEVKTSVAYLRYKTIRLFGKRHPVSHGITIISEISTLIATNIDGTTIKNTNNQQIKNERTFSPNKEKNERTQYSLTPKSKKEANTVPG